MKRLLAILLAFLLVVSFGCATLASKGDTTVQKTFDIHQASQYTYDGEFDPAVFFSWEVVKIVNCPSNHYHFFLKNPDTSSDVPLVETMNIKKDNDNYTLIAYRYLKNGEKYVFGLDRTRAHYEQLLPKLIDKSHGI